MNTQEAMDKVAELGRKNDIYGFIYPSRTSPSLLFDQKIGKITTTIVIPWDEIEDEAWPIIEARLKFYCKPQPIRTTING